MKPKHNLLVGLFICLALFFSINLASSALFRKARLDLTESGLFTLSDGTRSILEGMEDDVTLRLFFSKAMANDLTDLRDYARRVEELLAEYQSIAGSHLDVQIIEPEPFSEEEDLAVGYGMQGVPVNRAGEMLYFGLVGTNTTDGEEVMPFLQLQREEFLEYDLTKLIYRLAHPDRTTVGLLTTLPMSGGPMNPMQPQAAPQPWFIMETIEQTCDLEVIPTSAMEIPEEVDVLLVVHPKEFSDELLYAIDQFVLGGGHAAFYLDPHCEQDIPPQDPSNPMAAMTANRSSDLGPLLSSWGVEFSTEELVADNSKGLELTGRDGRPVKVVVYIGMSGDDCDSNDPITADLNTLNMGMSGNFLSSEGATTTLTPLVQTSDEAMLVDRMNITFGMDPDRLIRDYVPGSEKLTLAARLTGHVKSAFPGGLPNGAGQEGAESEGPAHLEDSTEPIQVVLVGDADLLHEGWWVQLRPFLNMRIAQPFANNGDMLVNIIDNLSGSSDLISLRSRGSFHRPFKYLAEIRTAARETSGEKEKELTKKLEQTERKIQELQQQKEGGVSSVTVSSEQRAEIDKFREDQVATRKELRAVQHSLSKKIENVGTLVKAINIFGVPALIFVLAFALGLLSIAPRSKQKA